MPVDRCIGAALAAFAVLLFAVVVPGQINVPRFEVGGGVGGIAASPLFFPRLMAVLLGLLGISLFVRGHNRARNLADGEGFPLVGAEILRVAGGAAILAAYAALLEPVGYVLLTPIALVALCAFLGYRRWTVVLATAFGFTAVVYGIFRYGMKILLPEGLLG